MSDYLSEELIIEIFTRLPPKSLIRFRSLSKTLFNLISSPEFIRKHALRSPQKILFTHSFGDLIFYTLHGEDELPLCLCPKREYIGIETIATFPYGSSFRTVGSCNGTFCLRNKKGLYLWNPSIRRKLSVPECPSKSELPPRGIGVGYDPISDDYKIVWISEVKDLSFVYTVKSGSWCEISSTKPPLSISSFEGFFFKGVLHWRVVSQEDEYILTFDLSTHVFGQIPLPGPPEAWFITGLTTIQDSLALVAYRMNVSDTWIWVWRDASWSVAFKLGTGKLPVMGALQPNNNGDLLIKTTSDEGLQVCNPTTGVRSRVVNLDEDSTLLDFRQCVETLHLLDMGKTAGETDEL